MGSGGGQLVITECREKVQKQVEALKQFYSPSKGKSGPKTGAAQGDADSCDSDYVPGDDETSGEDEEAKEILNKFKLLKKKLKSGQCAEIDDVFVEGPTD